MQTPGSQQIRVAVRVRPALTNEGAPECVHCVDGKRLLVDLYTDGKGGWPVRGSGPRARSFVFDSVHDRTTTQAELFHGVGMPRLLDAALDGYTATVFAYGQTGSGKTYTVSGAAIDTPMRSAVGQMPGYAPPADSAGLMQRTAHCIYEGLSQRVDTNYLVRATYLEIYNEQVVDLIEPGGPLAVRGSCTGGFYVEDLSVVHCRGLKDLQYVITKGLEHRHRRVHQLNSDSSRSHSIFSIYVDATDAQSAAAAGGACDADGGSILGKATAPAQRYGRISLLDLAGSENVRSSQSQGAGLKEAGSINKSLFALGQVIKALALPSGPPANRFAHVPYRDSNLTKLLSDSLGGSAVTLMIACCSPFLAYAEESMRTLHYACSAGAIRNRPVIKLDPQEQLIAQLRDEVQKLKAQVNHLRHELNLSNTRLVEHGLPPASPYVMASGGADPFESAAPASTVSLGQQLCGSDSHGAADHNAALATTATTSSGGDGWSSDSTDGCSPPKITPSHERALRTPRLGVLSVDREFSTNSYEEYRSLISQRLNSTHQQPRRGAEGVSHELAVLGHGTPGSPEPRSVTVSLAADLPTPPGFAPLAPTIHASDTCHKLCASQSYHAPSASPLDRRDEMSATDGPSHPRSSQGASSASTCTSMAVASRSKPLAINSCGSLSTLLSGDLSAAVSGAVSNRERSLERQLHALATFSATDLITSQHQRDRRLWLNSGATASACAWRASAAATGSSPCPNCHGPNSSLGTDPCDPAANSHASVQRTTGVADVSYQPPPTVAVSLAASLASLLPATTAVASESTGSTSSEHRAIAPSAVSEVTLATGSARANSAAASALLDYKAKAKALRVREFELERSLRALSKYSAATRLAP